MKTTDEPVKGWSQLSLFPGGAYELVLRVGLAPEADHAQFQFEVKVAGTHELLALSSRHHVDMATADKELTRWYRMLREALNEYGSPFPASPPED